MSMICSMPVICLEGPFPVRGVGSGSRDVDAWTETSLYTEDRGLQVPMTLEHDKTNVSLGRMSY
jgi:hypothetical protein